MIAHLYTYTDVKLSSQVSAGASAASFVVEDNFEDQEINVGDDCEDCAEVQALPDCFQQDGSELKYICRTRFARKTMEA